MTSIQQSPATAIHGGLTHGGSGVFRNDTCVGMRSVDQRVDTLLDEIIGQPFGAAKAADADRHGVRNRRGRAAGERERHIEVGTLGEAFAQQASFSGAAEDEDAWHG